MTRVLLPPLSASELEDLLEGIGTIPDCDDLATVWPIAELIHPSLTVITGQPGVGKSTLLQSMCRSLLDGRHWLGRATALPEGQRVLFGCEDVSGVMRVRQALPTHYESGQLISFRLNQWSAPGLTAAKLRARNVGLVILDSAYAAVGDVNDQPTAAAFISTVRALEVPVVIVHHEPKSGGGPAGAQAFAAAYRHTIRVTQTAPLNLVLHVSGNDVPEALRVALTIDRDSVVATAAVSTRSSSARLGRAEQAQRLAGHIAMRGIELTGNRSADATKLLGGGEGAEDPALVADLTAALGATMGHQKLRRLMADFADQFPPT